MHHTPTGSEPKHPVAGLLRQTRPHERDGGELRTPQASGSPRRLGAGVTNGRKQPWWLPRRWRLRDWRVRTRLAAAMLIPTIATVALAGAGITRSMVDASRFTQAEGIARLAEHASELVHELQRERDVTSGYLASGRRRGEPEVVAARQRVDYAVTQFRTAARQARDDQPELVDQMVTELATLDMVRTAVGKQSLTRSSILAQYTAMIRTMLTAAADISRPVDNDQLDDATQTLQALMLAKEYASQVRGELFSALESGNRPDNGVFMVGQATEIAGAITREQLAIDQFRRVASDEARNVYAEYVRGPAVSTAKFLQDTALRRQHRASLDLDSNDWFQSQTGKIGALRQVELHLLRDVLDLTDQLRTEAYEEALASGLMLFGVLVLAAAAAMAMARTMTRPLRRLQSTARGIAEVALPAVIERLRQPDVTDLSDIRPTPVRIDSLDEIGEVARAFEAVNAEAVRLAVDQAALRANVNAMFVNLARRSQSLVERQLRLIDELESREQDADQLEQLFKLDHLATRMRRHHDSLAVLAGARLGRQDNQATALADVALAAMSEVEQYSRITRGSFPELTLVGYAVNDVVHLLAELLENATAFSPPQTTVTISGHRAESGDVVVQITDDGIGMGPEELQKANARLAAPPVIDATVVRTMGLFVVGRLASKHHIRVEFHSRGTTGLTARVVLPAKLLGTDAAIRPRAPLAISARPAASPSLGVSDADAPRPPRYGERPAAIRPDPTDETSGMTDKSPTDGDAPMAPQPAVPAAGTSTERPRSASPWFSQFPSRSAPAASTEPPTIAATDEALYLRLSEAITRYKGGQPVESSPSDPAAARLPLPPRPAAAPPPPPGSSRSSGSAPTPEPPHTADAWVTSADEGWQAAAAASQPKYQKVSAAGLPVRPPMANLVPGSAGGPRSAATPGRSGDGTPRAGTAARSPEGVRSLLSTYYANYERGRVEDDGPEFPSADLVAGSPPAPPSPAPSPHRENQ